MRPADSHRCFKPPRLQSPHLNAYWTTNISIVSSCRKICLSPSFCIRGVMMWTWLAFGAQASFPSFHPSELSCSTWPTESRQTPASCCQALWRPNSWRLFTRRHGFTWRLLHEHQPIAMGTSEDPATDNLGCSSFHSILGTPMHDMARNRNAVVMSESTMHV